MKTLQPPTPQRPRLLFLHNCSSEWRPAPSLQLSVSGGRRAAAGAAVMLNRTAAHWCEAREADYVNVIFITSDQERKLVWKWGRRSSEIRWAVGGESRRKINVRLLGRSVCGTLWPRDTVTHAAPHHLAYIGAFWCFPLLRLFRPRGFTLCSVTWPLASPFYDLFVQISNSSVAVETRAAVCLCLCRRQH